jgi:hypothetical protein
MDLLLSVDPAQRDVLRRRILDSSSRSEDSGCWLWTRSFTVGGTPVVWDGKGTRSAARLAYVLWRGPISSRWMQVVRTCGDVRCVCPSHLSLLDRGLFGFHIRHGRRQAADS